MTSHDFDNAVNEFVHQETNTPDLWQRIEPQLAPRQSTPWIKAIALAASVIFVSWLGLVSFSTHQETEFEGLAHGSTNTRQTEITVARLRRDIEMLQLQLGDTETPLFGDVNKQTQDFERAARDVERALQSSPGNTTLENLLIYTYRQQIAWTQAVLMNQARNA